MKCLLLTVLVISVKSAPYTPISGQTITNQQLDQAMMDQIAQQSMERWILQNRYNSMQQQLLAMQQLQTLKKAIHSPVPTLYNLPQQPWIILVADTVGKTTNRLENTNENEELKLKLGIGDADSVVINAENEVNIPELNTFPQRAVVQLPNGQRLIIGSIISAIPFLPFEVNVPDTIGWMYNGIAGIIGGIGQRLPFRPKPTTESPVQQNEESMPPTQEPITQVQGSVMLPQEIEMPMQGSRLELMQKLRKQNLGMPILMLPLSPTMPIQVQVPMQV